MGSEIKGLKVRQLAKKILLIVRRKGGVVKDKSVVSFRKIRSSAEVSLEQPIRTSGTLNVHLLQSTNERLRPSTTTTSPACDT